MSKFPSCYLGKFLAVLRDLSFLYFDILYSVLL